MVPSIPHPIRALVRPDRTFIDWRPSFRQAAAAVVLLALVNAVGLHAGAGAIESTVSGSVAVDNPAYTPEWVCEMHQEDGVFNNSTIAGEPAEDCQNEPMTIQKPLGPVAGTAAGGLTLAAAIGTLVWWICIAAVFALFVVPGNRGDFSELL